MIKKLSATLSIALSIFIFSGTCINAYDAAKKEVIDGRVQDISADLNKRVFKKSKEVVLVNENAIVDSIGATPLAYSKDAPIVVTKNGNIGRVTRNYIKELGAENVTIIGGLNAVSKDAEKSLEKMGISVERIRGKDRYDTSLKMAREIYRTTGFDKAFIVSSSTGLENALSIYSYAAKNNYPIIWADDKNFDNVMDFLEGKKLKEIYAVGESEKFTVDLENRFKNLDILGEINKSDTNVDLINRFYKAEDTKKAYTANLEFGRRADVNEYISLGVVAAKENIPILICNENFSYVQEKFLKENNINELIEVGEEVGPYSIINVFISKTFISTTVLTLFLLVVTFRGIKYETK
ncbi:cell wall-binding repeat-containing protein [Metaclostridioides mangenotii]|uniref:cell wall-binding repeat-containing protein n=1 Tax=Metaclostridioides mangenotii TaxID=1540 RepID=UPI000489BD20|nr:cell wall-binding repeat-containing protein [Clostridioides mangenotii]